MTVTLTGVPNWVEQGPGPILGGNNVEIPGGPQAGAIEAIAVDPTNPNRVFVGTVNGGVWRTTNATAATPNWSALTDKFASLSIGAIAFSPLDPTFNTLIVGAGTFSSGQGDGGARTGLLRTTDGGNTWQSIGGTTFDGLNIRSVVPTSITTATGQVILVATQASAGGVFRSADGGATFVQISGSGGLPSGAASHLVADPGDPQRFYAAIPFQGVFRSTNGGVDWTPVNTGIDLTTDGVDNDADGATDEADEDITGAARIELAVHNNTGAGTNAVYAVLASQAPNDRAYGVFRSADQGANWTPIANLPQVSPGAQAARHLSIVADPNNPNVVFVGGDRQATSPFSGNLVRGDAATNTWTAVTRAGANNTAPHPDSRDMVFDSNGDILQSDDGGIYRLVDPNNPATRVWESMLGDLRLTEFYSVAYDSLNNVLMGGTQDNGAVLQPSFGSFTWNERIGGDGGVAQVETTSLPGVSFHYASSQNLGDFTRQVFDGTNTLIGSTSVGLAVNGAGGATLSGVETSLPSGSTIQFIQPYVLNAIDGSRMLIGTNYLYESTDRGDTLTSLGGLTDLNSDGVDNDGDAVSDEGDEFSPANPVGTIRGMAYGGRLGGVGNAFVTYVGAGSNLLLRTGPGDVSAFTTLTSYPGLFASDIVLDPENWQSAYVIDSSNVYHTPDAGVTWSTLTGNLGPGLRSIAFADGPTVDAVVVATTDGVFRMLSSQPGLWTEFGAGLPNAPVNDVRYDATDNLLLAGTYGRGAWIVPNALVSLTTPGVLQIDGDSDFPGQDDIIRLVRDPSNPLLLNVSLNGVPFGPYELSTLQQINVNGLGGNDQLIVDSSNGLISVPLGVRFDGGVGFDLVRLDQTGGDVQTSDTYSVGATNGSGTSTIVGPTGTQTVHFTGLEPLIDLVPAANLTVNATPEHNSINYSAGTVPTNGLVTIDNYESIEFSNKATLTVNALAGNDFMNFASATTPTGLTAITVNAAEGNDTAFFAGLTIPVTVNAGENNDYVDGSLMLAASLTLNGDSGDDTLIGGVLGDTLNGGVGDDILIGNAGNNTYVGTAGFDTLVIRGTGNNDTIDVHQTAAGTLVATVNGIVRNETIGGIDEIRVEALGGADVIRARHADALVGAPAGSVRVHVVGDAPNASDRLIVSDEGLGDTMVYRVGADGRSGSVTVGPLAPVVFEGIEFAQPLPGGTDGAGQLLTFKYDPYEANNSRATATFLGAGATINVDPTIDPGGLVFNGDPIPGDEDWYRFIAAETGVLDVQLFYTLVPALANGRAGLPGNGDLEMELRDAAGNLMVAGAELAAGERATIGVVRNQTYYLRVFGAGTAVNVYNFTAINVPVPTPFQVDLQAASDTGRHDSDDVTRDITPTFDIYLDDDRLEEFTNLNLAAGTDFIVQVFNNGVLLGNATFQGPAPGVGNNSRWEYTATAGQLQEGHNNFITAAVLITDRAAPPVSGRGPFSPTLQVTLDTIAPATPLLFLDAASDSGVVGQPATFSDRITNDTTPNFVGRAEANAIVRLWADGPPVSTGLVDASDFLFGLTVASPLDGDEAFPNGQWNLTSSLDLNNPNAPLNLPFDGWRQITATAEDLAGNESSRAAPAVLDLFIDTQGPQVFQQPFITGIPGFNLFDPKPSAGPTPLVRQISIPLRDLPNRDTVRFPNDPAVLAAVASDPGKYIVRGDHVGIIPVASITVVNDPLVNGAAATATIILTFAAPLPDDRYTLTVADTITDPAGNALDGESNASQPLDTLIFPSGDLQAGGGFVARFTVDSRPEIGTTAAGSIFIDINGNYVYDPEGQDNDRTNRDLVFTLGVRNPDGSAAPGAYTIHDALFAGNFASRFGGAADGYDKLAAYGFQSGVFRWIIDTNNDGVITPSLGDSITVQPAGFFIDGLPFAGNFDGNRVNGDEIGLFDGTRWWFDTNGDRVIGAGDLTVVGSLRGSPIVGDFDGDGHDDLATWLTDRFYFALSAGVDKGWLLGGLGIDATIDFGFPGVAEMPVAADMDRDGIDDIGLWVPRRAGSLPGDASEWYFLMSDNVPGSPGFVPPTPGSIAFLDHTFAPVPLGQDLFGQWGDEFSLPIVGNFDPPVAARTSSISTTAVPLGLVHGRLTSNGEAVSGDKWFTFEATRDGTIAIDAGVGALGGQIDVHLYDGQLQLLASGQVDAAGHAVLDRAITAGTSYLMRVVGSSSGIALNLVNQIPDIDRLDVNRDGLVTALDALIIINELNSAGPHALDLVARPIPQLYLDTSLDRFISAIDALQTINFINANPASSSSLAATESGDLARSLGSPSSEAADTQASINLHAPLADAVFADADAWESDTEVEPALLQAVGAATRPAGNGEDSDETVGDALDLDWDWLG